MVKLKDIFDLWYGVNLEVVNSTVVDNGIPFVSRQSVNNGVVCNVAPIEGIMPNPAHTLSIAVSGSVLSTFYHDYEYYSGRDVYVAKPKEPMTKEEMLYYAYIIEQNKYRYNYGRGANRTFKDILVPKREEIPYYIKDIITPTIKKETINKELIKLNTTNWKWFKIKELFEVRLTKGDIIADKVEEGDVPLISSGEGNNGVVKYINKNGDGKAETFKANSITLDMFCHANYQPRDYYAVGHGRVNILLPRFEINVYIGLFICSLMNKESYRFSYGRAVYSSVAEEMKIKLPATPSGNPDWQFMEDYIKSLPYSKNLEPIDPNEQIRALKKKLALTEHQLHEKGKQTVVNNIHYHEGSVHVDNSTNISLNPGK